MFARLQNINKDVVTIVAAVLTAAFCIWGIVFMGGEIGRMQHEYNERVASEKQQEQLVGEDAHEPMVIPEESVYDDSTGTYGPVVSPSGKLGMGYDMGGGLVMNSNGGIGFGLGL